MALLIHRETNELDLARFMLPLPPPKLLVDVLQIPLVARHVRLQLLYDVRLPERDEICPGPGDEHAGYLPQGGVEAVLVGVETVLMLPGDDDASDGGVGILFLKKEDVVRDPPMMEISDEGRNRPGQVVVVVSGARRRCRLEGEAGHRPIQLVDAARSSSITGGNIPPHRCISDGKATAAVGEQPVAPGGVFEFGRVENVEVKMVDGREGAEAVEADTDSSLLAALLVLALVSFGRLSSCWLAAAAWSMSLLSNLTARSMASPVSCCGRHFSEYGMRRLWPYMSGLTLTRMRRWRS